MTNILEFISANTFTIISLKKRVRVLKEYFESLLFGGNASAVSEGDQVWLNALSPEVKAFFTKENFYALVGQLNKQVDSIKPLVLYIAFDMPQDQIATITQYIRKSLNSPGLFLDIKKDPMLITGAAFVYRGVYKDYSLRNKIEKNREKILTEFRRSLV